MWIAVASLETGRPERRYFCVTKYGDRDAQRFAELAGAKMVKQILAREATAIHIISALASDLTKPAPSNQL